MQGEQTAKETQGGHVKMLEGRREESKNPPNTYFTERNLEMS